MKVVDAIESRRSIRDFSKKEVKWEHILEAIDAANQAPFARNYNNLKFIIVKDKEKIKHITESCQQNWIKNSNYVVVVCAETKKVQDYYGDIGIDYSKQQVGAAIQNFLLRITELKLASCWVGAFAEDQIASLLNIPEDYEVEAILPVGFPLNKRQKAIKKDKLDKKIFWEEWDQNKKPTNYHEPNTW